MKKWMLHIILWLILGILLYIFFSLFLPFWWAILRALTTIFLITGMFYLSGWWLANRFIIQKKNYLKFALLAIFLCIAFSVLRIRLINFFPDMVTPFRDQIPENISEWERKINLRRDFYFLNGFKGMNVRGTGFFTGFLANMFILLVATLFRLNEYRKEQEQEAGEKLRENQEAQIQYLKSQVNPHFLFNTLNNLYGLAYAKSDLAPQMIIELSDTMRYLIYETEKDAVSVEKELDFIRNYINIEKKRLSHPENIRLTMHINHSDGLIPPLLLLPFVENCFKHGTIGKTKEGWIEMGMWDDPKFFHFTCKNSYADGHLLVSTEKNSGLGLQNVKKRLDLLFGDQYELTISKQNNEYVVYLKIPFMVKKKPA